eukprot:439946-Rhodomonas_salina.6
MSGTDIAYCGAICLHACYAMFGTDIAYGGAICLRACYAISGTEIACDGAVCLRVLCDVRAICLRAGYALWGTEVGYGGMRAGRAAAPDTPRAGETPRGGPRQEGREQGERERGRGRGEGEEGEEEGGGGTVLSPLLPVSLLPVLLSRLPRHCGSPSSVCLRCYGMPGTHVAYGFTTRRAGGAQRSSWYWGWRSRRLPGTAPAYGVTPSLRMCRY